MRKRWRAYWFTVHRWLGLTVGLLFVLLGLTGSFLVFHHAIDAWLEPDLLRVEPSGEPRPLAEVFDVARSVGQQDGRVLKFADAPREKDRVWTVWFQSDAVPGSPFHHVYVDPYTAEVTGQRVRGTYLVTWLYLLHIQLLAGHNGEIVVGLTGIVLLVSIVSGLYLWWPLWKHSWRSAFAIRSGSRLMFDLHKTPGIASVPFLMVIAFTGVYMVFPGWFTPVGKLFSTKEPKPAVKLKSQPSDNAIPITVDRAVELGLAALPESKLNRIHFPTKPDSVFMIRARQPGDIRQWMGSSRAWVEQYSGEVLSVRDIREQDAVDTFFAWQFPLHNGEAFGLVGRWCVFVVGFLPAMLYGTGFWLWWRKGRARRKQQQNRVKAAKASPPAE
ncbi:PepSY-associated TM helix domain-containing protein [Bremerella cremea]|uniref:PepSY-associated TM helix domain-containing protein n=1 Tax=Bremerella cremea TaxID=1031537 RepID=UPI0031E9F13B